MRFLSYLRKSGKRASRFVVHLHSLYCNNFMNRLIFTYWRLYIYIETWSLSCFCHYGYCFCHHKYWSCFITFRLVSFVIYEVFLFVCFAIILSVDNGKCAKILNPLFYTFFPKFVFSSCFLTLVLLNPDMPCLCKQCRSRSVGFFRSQLIWSCTVCHSVNEFISTIRIK